METDLILVSLNDEQIAKAKEVNGQRKQITHALVSGNYGVKFGTEKQCRKYYSVWKEIFKNLFDNCYETDKYNFSTYQCSGNVVMQLIDESDKREPRIDFLGEAIKIEKMEMEKMKKGFWAKLFGG